MDGGERAVLYGETPDGLREPLPYLAVRVEITELRKWEWGRPFNRPLLPDELASFLSPAPNDVLRLPPPMYETYEMLKLRSPRGQVYRLWIRREDWIAEGVFKWFAERDARLEAELKRQQLCLEDKLAQLRIESERLGALARLRRGHLDLWESWWPVRLRMRYWRLCLAAKSRWGLARCWLRRLRETIGRAR